MATKTSQDNFAADNDGDLAADLLWGVPAIANFIGRTPRQTNYLIYKKIVPVIKRGRKTIVGSRSEIRKAFFSAHE
jgi:hypothetical protein